MMGLSEIPESPFLEEFLLSAELSCGLARGRGLEEMPAHARGGCRPFCLGQASCRSIFDIDLILTLEKAPLVCSLPH